MRLRKFIVHVLLYTAILFLSLDNLIDYSINAGFRAYINQVSPDITIHSLWKDAISDFLTISLTIYTFYLFIYKLLFIRKREIINILLALGIIIMNFLIVLLIEIVFADSFSFQKANYFSFLFSVFFLGGVGLGVRALVENMYVKMKRKEIENEKLQSELKLLRSQINPHFLFNNIDFSCHSSYLSYNLDKKNSKGNIDDELAILSNKKIKRTLKIMWKQGLQEESFLTRFLVKKWATKGMLRYSSEVTCEENSQKI